MVACPNDTGLYACLRYHSAKLMIASVQQGPSMPLFYRKGSQVSWVHSFERRASPETGREYEKYSKKGSGKPFWGRPAESRSIRGWRREAEKEQVLIPTFIVGVRIHKSWVVRLKSGRKFVD